jgi:hypothetical protein
MSKIVQAVSKIMNDVGSVKKEGNNAFHNYKYATAADISHKIQPLLAREGLVIFQTETERNFVSDGAALAITYEFQLAHKEGEIWPDRPKQTGMAAARNSKGGFDDKAANKCHTAARKYFMLALFQIPTGDYDDADAQEDRPAAKVEPIKRDNPHTVKPEDTGEYTHRIDPATGEVLDCIPVHKHRAAKLMPSKPETRAIAEDLLKRMREHKTAASLVEFAEDSAEEWAALPDKWLGHYQAEYQMLLDSLRKQKAA